MLLLVLLACVRYLLHFNGGADSYVTVGLTVSHVSFPPTVPPNRSPICFVLLFADTLFPITPQVKDQDAPPPWTAEFWVRREGPVGSVKPKRIQAAGSSRALAGIQGVVS